MFGIYSLRPELLVAKMDVSRRIFSSRYIRFNPFSGHNSGRGSTCMLIKIQGRLLVFFSFMCIMQAFLSFPYTCRLTHHGQSTFLPYGDGLCRCLLGYRRQSTDRAWMALHSGGRVALVPSILSSIEQFPQVVYLETSSVTRHVFSISSPGRHQRGRFVPLVLLSAAIRHALCAAVKKELVVVLLPHLVLRSGSCWNLVCVLFLNSICSVMYLILSSSTYIDN